MIDTWWVKPEQLDDSQKAVIELPIGKSHLITGPPGTGKTNLLLLRGSQLVHSSKRNVLIIVFTRTLREFVATGGHKYAFNIDNIKTLNKWHQEFFLELGIASEDDANFVNQRRKRMKQIKEILTRRKLSNLYDAIIIDEAQDYYADEIDIFFQLAPVVFAAADPRQHIYKLGEDDSSYLESKFRKNVYPLMYHYRNGKDICSVADELAKGWGIYEPLLPTCKYDEGRYPSSVKVNPCPSFENQVYEVCENLNRQLKAYPKDYFGILCPTRSCLKNVWSMVKKSQIAKYSILQSADEGYVPFDIEQPICVCTIHAAKGLEFRAVHIIEAESMKKSPLNRNIAYTAVTRAKTSLDVYHTESIPPYLDSALSVKSNTGKVAKLEELFK